MRKLVSLAGNLCRRLNWKIALGVLLLAALFSSARNFYRAYHEEPKVNLRPLSVAGDAVNAAVAAKQRMEELSARQQYMPQPTSGPDEVTRKGAIVVMHEKGFAAASLPPKPLAEALAELTGSARKKPAAMNLDGKGLGKKVMLLAKSDGAVRKKSGGLTGAFFSMTAAVSHKVFRTQKDYAAFTSTHRGDFPKADFRSQMVVMLLSMSDFPNRIFEITDCVYSSGKITVKYKINPLSAADQQDDAYSAAVVKKSGAKIVLEQVQ